MNRLAVFDIDGTLFRLPALELRFMWYLLEGGVFTAPRVLRSLSNGLSHGLSNGAGVRNYPRFWMQGLQLTELRRQAEEFLNRRMERLLIPAMQHRLNQSLREGSLTVLLSGVPEFLLESIGRRLGIHRIAGTRLLADSCGTISGDYERPRPHGAGKSTHLLRIANECGADLRASIGYANEGSDAHHLALLGQAVAVNPDRRLKRLADHLNWEKIYAR